MVSEGQGFFDLDSDDVIEDRTLVKPIRVRAILDSAEADKDVVKALSVKNNAAVLEQGRKKGRDEGLKKGLKQGRKKGLKKG